MLMTIDVGNSNITIAIFDGQQMKGRFRMRTKVRRSSDEFVEAFHDFLRKESIPVSSVRGVIISSVVPKIMHALKNSVIKCFSIEPLVMNPSMTCGMPVTLDNPLSVGNDRIADCVAAVKEHGYPILVVDFGTATTYDYVNEKGEFCAGAISVGIETGAQALWSQTAQLPEISIEKPETIMAKNTQTEMQAGIFYQFLGGFERTVQAYREAAGTDFPVIVTGGLGRVICQYTSLIDAYDPNLLFKGLCQIYNYETHE